MVAQAADGKFAWMRPYRSLALWGAYATNAAFWFGGVTGDTYIQAVAGISCVSALMFWCTLDAHVHGQEFVHGMWIPFMATLPVSLAFYLVWTRGNRGLISYAKALGIGFAIFFGVGLLGMLARPR